LKKKKAEEGAQIKYFFQVEIKLAIGKVQGIDVLIPKFLERKSSKLT